MTIVLLPPSESKVSPESGPKLNLANLAFAELTDKRSEAIAGLIKLSSGSQARALSALGISKKQEFELIRNQNLFTAATAPAWQIYSGVLFEALDAKSLTAPQLKKLCKLTYVQSALFGLVSLGDLIPAYRLSGDCVLPKIGSLPKFWASACTELLAQESGLIIDLRSGTYTKLGPLPTESNSVIPKILQRMKSGPPKVVSHHNKATKGRILRAIVQSKTKIRSIDDLSNIISTLGADVEIKVPTRSSDPIALEVVVDVL
ncbi:MAG: peroxide stress protein YaaA [Actinobacteria bacterium]|nr:peroxide stress protein YaaA [Actinomycetota bacterium]